MLHKLFTVNQTIYCIYCELSPRQHKTHFPPQKMEQKHEILTFWDALKEDKKHKSSISREGNSKNVGVCYVMDGKFIFEIIQPSAWCFSAVWVSWVTSRDQREKLHPYLALWDASSDNQHQTTATITIIPTKGMERTGCSEGWMNLWGGNRNKHKDHRNGGNEWTDGWNENSKQQKHR